MLPHVTARRWPLVAACGKFQPFHNDHLLYVLAAFEWGDHVLIGITNPDPHYVKSEEADPARSKPESNPATYYERYLMVQRSLDNEGIPRTRYDVVPFPLNVPESWFYYIPREAVFVLTLYGDDKWLEVRKHKLEEKGLQTHVLWSKNEKTVTGVQVRESIITDGNWRDLVPQGTAAIIAEYRIDLRIKALAVGSSKDFYRP